MSDKTSGYLDMELLRFTTAGSVDDGKSTLIGRLLYDSKAIFEDQMEAIEISSKKRGDTEVDLALLTDGLRAEREQGITIDVAYRYFATPKRKFIIADTPGHIQYTRNMVTGASTANCALILVDARHGVIEQTLRHSYIANLLQIPHLIVCINKMDLMGYSEETYENIKNEYQKVADKLNIKDVRFIPISAKFGDNVVDASENMDWYKGETLLTLLETIEILDDRNHKDARFPVQYVIRPQSDEFHDYRGFAGRVASGIFKPGDKVKVLPSGRETTIKAIDTLNGELDIAFTPQSVTLRLNDEIDTSRGDMIVAADNVPRMEQEFDAMVCWMNERPMIQGGKYTIKHTSNETRCMVRNVNFKVDINTLEEMTDDKTIGLNDIASLKLKTAKPLFFDSYNKNRNTGSFILIDEATNETVAAGMIR
ncbi:sulfate adenylyltransferase subunit CysN [Ancylomarina euxinus]|uniref:sulfate adenylyltransferase n=1 Tax=Ancylomarina euxinus TaxID=2283627 RepID=A0A425Y0S9_9BACT|nr:sulfate adenylyltransferase subunit CysN [Ancylomarina euxinus]MCZ4695274.1 sulfate adenylyltransferase subunit CysN [Ancylomarina euxinus]MUP15471.1 sulfate adenylyltransferase subunit CysN [Ancylomarina euxinus]RRG21180.1 sulfate adenylyltransferase subunit CysN [Ancylomarina euxinus]